MVNNIIEKFLFIILIVLLGCTHEVQMSKSSFTASNINITLTCVSCPTLPICPITDDILVNSATTYSVCPPQPSGQGVFTLTQNNCLIWTPSFTANQIVETCIVACNGFMCDTTLITIFPPLPSDTTFTGVPCNPNIVYFEKDVLPILTANCAYSGCHNATSAKDGIILDSYNNVIKTGKIKVGSPSGSKIFEVITETDPKDIMPQLPAAKLNSEQIQTIEKWINQGAKNELCDENPGGCNTDNVSFSNYVRPALASCIACHKSGNTGGGLNLESYEGMKSAAVSGRLFGAIAWSNGYKPMPQGGSKIPECTINKIKSWIDAGSPDN